ncbi:hypothetical protein CCACVL1_09626 [Corchorus capsularis]|uniref:Uncharacterized protein n=1 Tax=Corchorus capsularis TaxID=210143 RepID=A0A1R3IUU0_COCAP|nr:hypothetical protein CCACVL1_09626 [Corchorus capsularis]
MDIPIWEPKSETLSKRAMEMEDREVKHRVR